MATQHPPRTLAVLMFPGYELLDAAGPVEIFGQLPGLRIITVAESSGSPTLGSADTNIRWAADFSYTEVLAGAAGPISWLLVPGGFGTRQQAVSPACLHFLRQIASTAELVMSVCTGAGLLAAAGLLEGRRATSNKQAWAWVSSVRPTPEAAAAAGGTGDSAPAAGGITWVYKARWVWDGIFVTSAGVSAGMDMALAVVRKMYGPDVAKEMAANAEYEAHEDSEWDPFSALYSYPNT